jgi:hypothetical protein
MDFGINLSGYFPPPPLGCSDTRSTITGATTDLLYQPRTMANDKRVAIGGMLGRGIRRRAPVPLCQPQIPHDLTWARTRAAAAGSQ